MNAIKDAIKAGKTVVGTAGSPAVDTAMLSDAGFDFLLFDTQHSPYELKQMQAPIAAMKGKQTAPIVRVAVNQAWQICTALDAGARAIDVDVEAHVAPYLACSGRAPTRRASSSEASSAPIEITTEIRVRRIAPASPPGTWVKV